jgi:hypothetical protein
MLPNMEILKSSSIRENEMYFGSSGGEIGWMFDRSTWVFLAIMFGLAVWKLIDILYWVLTHVTISWS